jgi:AcrR family transcriptional regulator
MARAQSKSSVDRAARSNGRTPRNNVREAEILAASVEIFHANGYAATSVEDVAQAVGILKGSLYYYIDSKEDLLLRIVEGVHEDVQAVMDEVFAMEDVTPLERISEFVRVLVEFNARNVKRVRVYYHDYDQLSEARLADIRKRRRDQEHTLIRLVQQAKDAGEVPPDMNERLVAKAAFAMIVWMYTWNKPRGSVSAKGLGEFFAKFVVDGLRGGLPAATATPAPKAAPKAATKPAAKAAAKPAPKGARKARAPRTAATS